MRIADRIERNGLDVQMADLERIVGAAVAVEAETGEAVACNGRKRRDGSYYACLRRPWNNFAKLT
jgi:hypothetical protein